MLIVHVDIQVKPEYIEEFIAATRENVQQSQKEPGIYRFELIRSNEDPGNFMLIEIYRDEDAPAAHKKTSHYQTWRETVEKMMARPRQSRKYHDICPKLA